MNTIPLDMLRSAIRMHAIFKEYGFKCSQAVTVCENCKECTGHYVTIWPWEYQ